MEANIVPSSSVSFREVEFFSDPLPPISAAGKGRNPPSSVFVYGVRRLAKLHAAVLEPGFFWVVVSMAMCVKCRWGFRCKGVASGHCRGALEMRMFSGDGVDLQDRKKAAVLV
ncbi:Uncharacterized protein Rs2_32596 [Raphanus sativus]|nr:Uncharacterized protein Rs2_32596 [Raphanus sativus]